MKNIDYIEKQFKECIKDMPILEFKLYQLSFIEGLYEAFIEHDEKKALRYKNMIEDTTRYYSENHDHVYINELKVRLRTANEFLIKALEENNKSISFFIEESYQDYNNLTCLSTEILKALLEYAKTNEGKESKTMIKKVLGITEDNLKSIKCFIDIHGKEFPELSKDNDSSFYWLIKGYDEYKAVREQIKEL